MTLYYHRERDGGSLPPKKSPRGPIGIPGLGIMLKSAAAVLIVIAAVIQATGGLQKVEMRIARAHHGRNGSKPVVLLALERKNGAFDPMEVAMVLRGLGKFLPERIILNGSVRGDADASPMLAGMLERMRSQGIVIAGGGTVGKEPLYRSLSLCRYQPPAPLRPPSSLNIVEGKPDAAGTDCAAVTINGGTLPLLAVTGNGEPVGTAWWEALCPSPSSGPCWLIANRFLLMPDHAPLLLTPDGATASILPGADRVMKSDDFLLGIEEKERGALRPGFDTLWDRAVVLIGSTEDEQAASSVAGLKEYLSLRRLPPAVQFLLALLWIILLLVMAPLSRMVRSATGILLLPVIAGVTWAGVFNGILLPFLPPLVMALLLFVPYPRDTTGTRKEDR